jgi:hypothetical protein
MKKFVIIMVISLLAVNIFSTQKKMEKPAELSFTFSPVKSNLSDKITPTPFASKQLGRSAVKVILWRTGLALMVSSGVLLAVSAIYMAVIYDQYQIQGPPEEGEASYPYWIAGISLMITSLGVFIAGFIPLSIALIMNSKSAGNMKFFFESEGLEEVSMGLKIKL